ncbi:MAG TPA: DUF3300 domain-containing protein [Stenotrophomonas sp.]|nr:DUF3300 domain-containing protein [Stenotrophomonas sp.]
MRIRWLSGGVVLLLAMAACSRTSEQNAETSKTPPAAPAVSTTPAPATPEASAAPSEAVFSREELDQMVAPIALYPDPLLAQVLMASTYPGNVADAVAWSKAHPKAKGDDAVKQVADQPWDPSVQSLVAFPQALATLGQDPAWVQRLGDSFLAQPDQVMDAVQRLRRQAQAAGNLGSNQYQNVSVQDAAPEPAMASAPAGDAGLATAAEPEQTIVIQPADPAVVYVPSYNPTTVYGSWAYPAYPPAYYPPPPGYYAGNALAAGLAFGVGVAITDSLWGGFDWHHDDVDINVNRYNNINVNRRLDVNQNTWRHDPSHRDGVPYRDRASREQFGRQLDGADRRANFRGDDPARAQERERARASIQQHGIEAPARNNQQARERAKAASERGGDRIGARDGGIHHDAARQRAQAATAASQRAGGAGHDRAQRAAGADHDRAQRAANAGAGARERPHAGQGGAAARPHPQVAHRQTQGSNQQVRQQAHQRAQPGNAAQHNAFQGASHPNAAHAQMQRGHNSQAAAHRPAASRPQAHPVQRPSHPPQRQGGGRRH